MKIGIYCFCTGNYITFLHTFYKTHEQHFLKDHEKKYVVLSNHNPKQFNIFNHDNIHYHQIEHVSGGHAFLNKLTVIADTINGELFDDCDLIYIPNINFFVNKEVTLDLIYDPDKELTFCRAANIRESCEKNLRSACYVEHCNVYINGGFLFGKKRAILKAVNFAIDCLVKDLNTIKRFPIWHDESAYNKYINGREDRFKILTDGIICPIFASIAKYPKICKNNITVLEKRWFFPNYKINKYYPLSYLVKDIECDAFIKTNCGIYCLYNGNLIRQVTDKECNAFAKFVSNDILMIGDAKTIRIFKFNNHSQMYHIFKAFRIKSR